MPEQYLVPGLLWYNDNCALNQSEKLDGVAVNNEEFPKYGTGEELVDYITNLAQIGILSDSHISLFREFYSKVFKLVTSS